MVESKVRGNKEIHNKLELGKKIKKPVHKQCVYFCYTKILRVLNSEVETTCSKKKKTNNPAFKSAGIVKKAMTLHLKTRILSKATTENKKESEDRISHPLSEFTLIEKHSH